MKLKYYRLRFYKYLISFANRFCEYCSDFILKAIQRNIVGNESFNLPYWIPGGTVIAGIYLQANQIFVESETGSISARFPSPESFNLNSS